MPIDKEGAMSFFNTKQQFGLFTKILHWSLFLLITAEFVIRYKRAYVLKGSPEQLQYMLWHKSIGIIVLCLALFLLMSRYIGHRPLAPKGMSIVHEKMTRWGHAFLYLLMFLITTSGYFMSAFRGDTISIFNWYDLPKIIEVNQTLAALCFEIHRITSYAILPLVFGHILASLYHHIILKNEVLKRCGKF